MYISLMSQADVGDCHALGEPRMKQSFILGSHRVLEVFVGPNIVLTCRTKQSVTTNMLNSFP